MGERELNPEQLPPSGIRILRQQWLPEQFGNLQDALAEFTLAQKRNNFRHGREWSPRDLAIAQEVVNLTEEVEAEWQRLIQECFPGKRIDLLFIHPPSRKGPSQVESDSPWHRDGDAPQSEYLQAEIILWSNREPTEVRDIDTKQEFILPSGSVFSINNERFEHRRPPTVSPDRFLAHAAVWLDQPER